MLEKSFFRPFEFCIDIAKMAPIILIVQPTIGYPFFSEKPEFLSTYPEADSTSSIIRSSALKNTTDLFWYLGSVEQIFPFQFEIEIRICLERERIQAVFSSLELVFATPCVWLDYSPRFIAISLILVVRLHFHVERVINIAKNYLHRLMELFSIFNVLFINIIISFSIEIYEKLYEYAFEYEFAYVLDPLDWFSGTHKPSLFRQCPSMHSHVEPL